MVGPGDHRCGACACAAEAGLAPGPRLSPALDGGAPGRGQGAEYL